jgi:hypothetical protein
MHLLAPAEPILNDRDAYEYVGAHPLAANCPFSIYCYRPMAPVLVSWLPFDSDTSWRVYQVSANAAAGTLIALAAATLSASGVAAALASVAAQASYGFAFTAYDPYAADPLVYVFAALLTWCWITNRVNAAILLGAIGIFAKETVALLTLCLAIAAAIERREGWQRWLLPLAVSGALLATLHIVSRVWLNWEIASNPAAQLSHGSWLGLWWRNNPFLDRKLYMVFATFGFLWVLAAAAWRVAPPPWRALALGSIAPMLALTIAQTPERAISNAFFVVVPLGAALAARWPALGTLAIGLNALVTAKAGTSSALLPSGRWLLLPAAIAAAAVIMRGGLPASRSASARPNRR